MGGAPAPQEPVGSRGPGWPAPDDAWEWVRRAALDCGRDRRCRLVTIGADSVAHGLAALAAHEAASVFVVGTSARGAAGRLRAGTGARRLVQAAHCPVAVAPAGWRARRHGPHPVFGVGVDGIGEASGALAWAGTLAAAGAATLQVVDGDPVEYLTATDGLDLLVVGVLPRGPLGTALHAGESTTLPGRTACPLLIVPPAWARRPAFGATLP